MSKKINPLFCLALIFGAMIALTGAAGCAPRRGSAPAVRVNPAGEVTPLPARPAETVHVVRIATALPATSLPKTLPPAQSPGGMHAPAGTPPGKPAPVEAVPVEVIERAAADLAQRSGLAKSDIRLVLARAVDWPDGSLGCPPEPGMAYVQVITPGYLVILDAGGQTYEYHLDRGQTMLSCQPADILPYPNIPVPPGEIKDKLP
jgi:hypothetical protein